MPMPRSWGKRIFFTPLLDQEVDNPTGTFRIPAAHSMPGRKCPRSSSRKITMSVFLGLFSAGWARLEVAHGRHTHVQSSSWRNATLIERDTTTSAW